jgi:hypothetical protein
MTGACVAWTLALSACSGEATDEPTAEDYDDVAKSLGTLVAERGDGGEIGSIHDSAMIASGAVPFGLAFDISGEVHGNRLGLEYHYVLECADAMGNALDVCDESTDTANIVVEWSGDLVAPPELTASMDRSSEWTLSNVQSGTANLSGEGAFEFDAAVTTDSVERRYHFQYDASYEDILVGLDPPQIVGGTVRYEIRADRLVQSDGGADVDASFAIDAVLTFDGGGAATLVLDGTRTYDVSTTTGAVSLRVGG